jgi:hypothetical protein
MSCRKQPLARHLFYQHDQRLSASFYGFLPIAVTVPDIVIAPLILDYIILL